MISMEENRETNRKIGQMDELTQTIQFGIHGPPELKKGERNQYLGNFKERVLKALTFDQIEEKGTYREIEDAIRDKRASTLILSRKADLKSAREYIDLARTYGLGFKTVDSPDFVGEVGLVVVSDSAVVVTDILVVNRTTRLLRKGIPIKLIEAEGKKICDRCFALLQSEAPEEVPRYRRLSFLDRVLGGKCYGCSKEDA